MNELMFILKEFVDDVVPCRHAAGDKEVNSMMTIDTFERIKY